MNCLFKLKINTKDIIDVYIGTYHELLTDVKGIFGEEMKNKVVAWARGSKDGDKFIDEGIFIFNLG